MKPFNLTVMMYHYVRDPGDAAEAGSGIPGLPRQIFETQLDYLMRRYTLIAWPVLCQFLLEDEPLPPAACLLTFDDGVCDHYLNVYPALQAHGLSGLFFTLARTPEEGLALGHKIHFLLAKLGLITLREEIWLRLTAEQRVQYHHAVEKYRTQYADLAVFKAILQRDLSVEAEPILRDLFEETIGFEVEITQNYYLTPAQIAKMSAAGMYFGGHSHSHPWLDWVSSDVQGAEIKASATHLQTIEPGPWAFAYPYGGLSEALPETLKANQFAAAFTTKAQTHHTDPFYIGRLDGEALTALPDASLVMGVAS
jgi:peptidoglycan/xylan/chitin deacetylase (PgdA/CDA1 family)